MACGSECCCAPLSGGVPLEEITCKNACCAADDDGDDDDDDDDDDDTCKDACCASEVPLKVELEGNKPGDGCKEKCCVDEESSDPAAAIAKTAPREGGDTCTDSCCAGQGRKTPEAPDNNSDLGCCKDTCCSEKKPASAAAAEDPNNPSCCRGKPSPCCDESCLDRLAARENHGPSTRENYAAKLEALGCLCRALLALGQESCCAPPKRSSLERKRCSRTSSSSVVSRQSLDSCCATGSAVKASAASVQATSRVRGKGCAQGVSLIKRNTCKDECCEVFETVGRASVDSCCARDGKIASLSTSITTSNVPLDATRVVDLENGMSGKEHVILSISGMTCTGCETKLKRTLASLNSVRNLRTSLILSRAEFDLDLAAASVAEVVKHLERTTEFKCEKVTNQGSNVDIVVPGGADGFIEQAQEQDWPLGVTEMTAVDKNTVNIAFDAKIVGARDLVEKGWANPMTLAPPRTDPTLDAGSKHVRHVGLVTILSAVLTIPVLVMSWAPLPDREIAYGSASLALATLVQLLVAGPFYPKALKSLVFSRVIEMDLLIVLSTTTAYVFSVVSFAYLTAGQRLSTGEFFETSTLLVTLIMVGRYVAALARQKAVESISIRSLQASNAVLVGETTGREEEMDVRLLQYGDMFKVLPDSKIPTDGTVISGSSEVDESMITGESRPVEKYVKSAVVAGSINGAGTLMVRLNRLPGDNTISAIADMVDEAKLSKPKLQDIADRVASYFVPVVATLTVITFVVWVAVGVAVQGKTGSEAVVQAITFAITVLIVSCPCAVGLAVPMVIVIASGVAAERGVIIKSADTIEVAHKTSHVVLDKTGTLTEGRLTVAREAYLADDSSTGRTKSLLLALLAGNKHPVSAAVAAQLRGEGVSPAAGVSEPRVLTGKGVEATTSSGLTLRAGNCRWLGLSADSHVKPILSGGYTTLCFTMDGSLVAVLGLQDSLRPEALSTVTELHRRGITVHVISGDDDAAVRAVTGRLDIPDDHVRSRCTPADKQSYVQHLLQVPPTARSPAPTKRAGRGSASRAPTVIIFCGDGTNDAVALAQATVGVHMNDSGGTDVARSAADVVLMRPDLGGILTLMNVSRNSVRRIAFNFGWSAVYNLFAVLLGAGAFFSLDGARIPPEFAGLGELVSVLPVVVAALLLRWERI